jgi:hypothetical protein
MNSQVLKTVPKKSSSEMSAAEHLGCQITLIDWSHDHCRFFLEEKGCCGFPGASSCAKHPNKWSWHQRQLIPVEALHECPLMSVAKQHEKDLSSRFRRVWRGDNLVPIRGGKLVPQEAHYRRPNEEEIEEFFAKQA